MPPLTKSAPLRVLVTGAGGQTGGIVVRKLLQHGSNAFIPRALVRSTESEAKLRENLGDLSLGLDVVIGDITKPETLDAAFKDIDALVIGTSGMPRIDKLSLVGVIFKKVFTLGMVASKPSFWFDDGQSPQEVDWIGQQKQIDSSKAAGVKHVVLVSSMGGTKPDHFLNSQMDGIVLWKRRAECYLMASGLKYTILHPGGLLPHFGSKEPAPGGRRELVLGVDDKLMEDGTNRNMIPREDVAEVCVQSLLNPKVAQGRSFDLGSMPETEKEHNVDLESLLQPLGDTNCAYTAADAVFTGLGGEKNRSCFCS